MNYEPLPRCHVPDDGISGHGAAAAAVGDDQALPAADGNRAAGLYRHSLKVRIVRGEKALGDEVGHELAAADPRQHLVEPTHAEFRENATQAPEVEVVDALVGMGERAVEQASAERDAVRCLLGLERLTDTAAGLAGHHEG